MYSIFVCYLDLCNMLVRLSDVAAEEAVDVTRRYTQNWAQVLMRRNKVSEDILAQVRRDF